MMTPGGEGSIDRACQTARVSRAGFYRHFDAHAPREAETHLRDAIQQVALENRSYGYRRVTAALRAQGLVVNHKRVLRAMREDNLLSLRKRRYVLTTNSRHTYAVYPNLASQMVVASVNQLWVADITYIRLREQFVYLAVILDAYSRRVIGWELRDNLQAELAVAALDRALAQRALTPGIVHHSDRGVQYCADDYVSKLLAHGFQVSMSRAGNPYDNALAESFMKTLKVEEVYLSNYRDIDDARRSIQNFLESVYNEQRIHSALNYTSPAAFEAAVPRDQPVS